MLENENKIRWKKTSQKIDTQITNKQYLTFCQMIHIKQNIGFKSQ